MKALQRPMLRMHNPVEPQVIRTMTPAGSDTLLFAAPQPPTLISANRGATLSTYLGAPRFECAPRGARPSSWSIEVQQRRGEVQSGAQGPEALRRTKSRQNAAAARASPMPLGGQLRRRWSPPNMDDVAWVRQAARKLHGLRQGRCAATTATTTADTATGATNEAAAAVADATADAMAVVTAT